MSGGAAVFRMLCGRDLTFGKHKHAEGAAWGVASVGEIKVLTETELKKTRHVLSRCLKVNGNDTLSCQPPISASASEGAGERALTHALRRKAAPQIAFN